MMMTFILGARRFICLHLKLYFMTLLLLIRKVKVGYRLKEIYNITEAFVREIFVYSSR